MRPAFASEQVGSDIANVTRPADSYGSRRARQIQFVTPLPPPACEQGITDRLVLDNVAVAQSGDYSVEARNDIGMAVSPESRLIVSPALSLSLTPAPGGMWCVWFRFEGLPGRTYELLRATTVTGPWDTMTTLVAPWNIEIERFDTAAPPPAGFYRVRRVP